MKSNDKMAAARLMACKRMGYFRSAVMALVPKQAPMTDSNGNPTFGVTKSGVLLWHPDALNNWSVSETAAVLIHEISHLLRNHSDRGERMGADPTVWNIAADLAINSDIAATKLKLPDGGVFPEDFGWEDGLLAEEYYHKLSQLDQQQKAQSGGDGEGDDDGDSKPRKGIGSGQCGGCAGNPGEGEEQHAGRSGRSEIEMKRVKRQVAEDIQKEASRGRGTVPGHWARWAGDQLQPAQIPWRQKLARAVRNAIAYRPGCVDYHSTRPSRRQAGVGFGPGKPIMPALRAPIPRVSVIVDTSGSMSSEELTEAVSECNGILQATGSEATFCACDAKVQTFQKVRHWKDIAKLLTGGGGTDFRPPIEAMAELRPRPDVVVFITDGMGPAPAIPPPFKMVWVLVGPHRQKPYAGGYSGDPITYGEFIELLRDGETEIAA